MVKSPSSSRTYFLHEHKVVSPPPPPLCKPLSKTDHWLKLGLARKFCPLADDRDYICVVVVKYTPPKHDKKPTVQSPYATIPTLFGTYKLTLHIDCPTKSKIPKPLQESPTMTLDEYVGDERDANAPLWIQHLIGSALQNTMSSMPSSSGTYIRSPSLTIKMIEWAITAEEGTVNTSDDIRKQAKKWGFTWPTKQSLVEVEKGG
ncbi:hypothetical protein C8Q75DRAFT_808306 [Abortiporus biennis]|nr:hypothetical protein C8Q75DRAFT_808306 [Abortiporus biennis]